MFQRLLFWLFKDLFGAWRAYCRMLEDGLHEIRDRLRVLEQGVQGGPPRMPVYVTLRGSYQQGDKRVAYGWTQKVLIEEGHGCALPFEPHNVFHCERVDILGPADITGVNVGNQCQEMPKHQHPATFEFLTTCDVGNRITVHLQGTP